MCYPAVSNTMAPSTRPQDIGHQKRVQTAKAILHISAAGSWMARLLICLMDTEVCDFSFLSSFSSHFSWLSFSTALIYQTVVPYLSIWRKRERKKKQETNPIYFSQIGSILQKTDIILPTTTTSNPLDDPEEQGEQDSIPETKLLQKLATFDKITVYGHEVQPDAQEDVYIKGINEWIGLAGAVSFCLSFSSWRERKGTKMAEGKVLITRTDEFILSGSFGDCAWSMRRFKWIKRFLDGMVDM